MVLGGTLLFICSRSDSWVYQCWSNKFMKMVRKSFILLSLLLVTVNSETVYISSSSNDSTCRDDACWSLSEWARSNSVNSNRLDLVFLPGNHSLNMAILTLNTTPYVSLTSSTKNTNTYWESVHWCWQQIKSHYKLLCISKFSFQA